MVHYALTENKILVITENSFSPQGTRAMNLSKRSRTGGLGSVTGDSGSGASRGSSTRLLSLSGKREGKPEEDEERRRRTTTTRRSKKKGKRRTGRRRTRRRRTRRRTRKNGKWRLGGGGD